MQEWSEEWFKRQCLTVSARNRSGGFAETKKAPFAPLRGEKSKIVPAGTSFRLEVTDESDVIDVFHIAPERLYVYL